MNTLPGVPSDDLEATIEACHESLRAFMKGDPEPLKRLYSHADDATLANPFGLAVRGWEQVAMTMEQAATKYEDGDLVGIGRLTTLETADLAFIVEEERFSAKVGGREEMSEFSLRVTTIFRREDGTWKVVHRPADPITTAQPTDSILR